MKSAFIGYDERLNTSTTRSSLGSRSFVATALADTGCRSAVHRRYSNRY